MRVSWIRSNFFTSGTENFMLIDWPKVLFPLSWAHLWLCLSCTCALFFCGWFFRIPNYVNRFCAYEYEKSKDMATAALAYKCTEVAYMRVIYSSHAGASRDRHELQTALHVVPHGNWYNPWFKKVFYCMEEAEFLLLAIYLIMKCLNAFFLFSDFLKINLIMSIDEREPWYCGGLYDSESMVAHC